MTGSLYISVDAINPPSLAAPSKLQFAAANGSQPVALVYTDFDAYRPPAGLKLMGNQGGEWLEAPLLIGDRLVTATSLRGSNPHEGFVVSLYNGASYANQNSSVIGTVKITLPFGWNNGMNVYKIMIYEYNGRGASEITVSGYNYNSGSAWYNYTTQVNGAFEGAIRLGYDGSRCCILLGDTSYNWNYPQIYVHQVFSGFGGNNSDIDGAYSISIITSETGLSSVTSVPKTSMNKWDTNFIRALNKNGYYGMAIVGDSDNVYIRAPRLGIIPYSSGNPGEGMLGTEGWQFTHIYVNQTKTQRVSSVTHNLYIGSSGNSGWVYCQDLCSANGAAEAYWSIRTNGSAVFTNLTSKNIITGNIDGYATYLPTRYNGGTQANPQTYFSQYMGLRVAMTGIGFGGPWSDTLWINGYSGNDVLPMCALHFIRNGTPRFGISTQNSNGTSYGTNYEVWTAYNSNKAGVNWSAETFFAGSGVKSRNICIEVNNSGVSGNCGSEINNWNSHLYLQHQSSNNIIMCNAGGKVVIGGISSDFRLNVNGDIIAAGWLRTSGAVGWYSQTYGGGIYCTDSDSVCIYNNKVLYNSGFRQWGIGGHHCGLKLYNANHIGINLANAKYTWGIYSNNDGNMYIGRRDGDVNNTTGGYVITLGYSTLSMNGNILASGGITAKSTSDLRLKTIITKKKSYIDTILDIGMVFDYEFNSIAKNRKHKNTDNFKHIGLSYQSLKKELPIAVGEDEDGYGYINYISPDLISLSIGAIQEIILEENKIKKDIIILKSEIEYLKSENIILKKRLGLIA